jgi:hypothetical protein
MGLPTKESEQKPKFAYQKIKNDALQIPDLYNSLEQNFKHIHLGLRQALDYSIRGSTTIYRERF